MTSGSLESMPVAPGLCTYAPKESAAGPRGLSSACSHETTIHDSVPPSPHHKSGQCEVVAAWIGTFPWMQWPSLVLRTTLAHLLHQVQSMPRASKLFTQFLLLLFANQQTEVITGFKVKTVKDFSSTVGQCLFDTVLIRGRQWSYFFYNLASDCLGPLILSDTITCYLWPGRTTKPSCSSNSHLFSLTANHYTDVKSRVHLELNTRHEAFSPKLTPSNVCVWGRSR